MANPLTSPPDWRSRIRKIEIPSGSEGEVDRVVRAADGRGGYLHWDLLKARPQPAGLSPEDIWALVRFSRSHRDLPLNLLRDKAGQPFRLVRDEVSTAVLQGIDNQERAWRHMAASGEAPEEEASTRFNAAIVEAHSSSVLAGAKLSLQSAQHLLHTRSKPRDLSQKMVCNNFNALQLVQDRSGEPLCVDLLLELHRTITTGTLRDRHHVGNFRADDEVQVCERSSRHVVFTPPHVRELPGRVAHLCEFANTDDEEGRHLGPIHKAILLHHQLAYDHPFTDGNGRTARALCAWYLQHSGHRWSCAISLSRAIADTLSEYQRAFLAVQSDGGDATYFLRHQLACIEQEIQRLAESHRQRHELKCWLIGQNRATKSLNVRQLCLLDHALGGREGHFEAQTHANHHGVTQPTAWKDLTTLRDQGLLAETKQGRKSVYHPSKKLLQLAEARFSQ